jgi:hypothetical protein
MHEFLIYFSLQVEGVSLYDQNIYSVHTGSGCSISDSAVSSMTKVKIVQTDGTNCGQHHSCFARHLPTSN